MRSHIADRRLPPSIGTEDYAIAADFCNFDQNNGSLVHNCIYRILAATETGEDTGIFEGTVAYTDDELTHQLAEQRQVVHT